MTASDPQARAPTGPVAVVTGASSGIGREMALALARGGTAVVILGRDASRGREVLAEIEEESGDREASLVCADFARQAEVRRASAEILARHPRIDILLNNAGLYERRLSESPDGIETTFAVNHLAPYLLTRLLLPALTAAASPGRSARIVNVASEAHRGARFDPADPEGRKEGKGYGRYGRSKLANILFTYELARRLDGSRVTVNALHPGVIATRIVRDTPAFVRVLWSLFARSPAKGAATPVWLATSPAVEGLTGRYFVDCREARSSPESLDREAQARLWAVSARMTGLSDD